MVRLVNCISRKHYSRCEDVVNEFKALGVNYRSGSRQISLGGFSVSALRDANWVWKDIFQEIREKDIEEILILDHGGAVLPFIPAELIEKYNVIGVEKTAGGLVKLAKRGALPFPIITIANCAIKKYVEPSFIAEAVFSKLMPLLNEMKESKGICGVVGYGAIGQAITEKLLSYGFQVIIYDSSPEQLAAISHNNLNKTTDIKAVFSNADYIYGCTGTDITEEATELFRCGSRKKTLINCASGDYEFATLLHELFPPTNLKHQSLNPLDDLMYQNKIGGNIRIVRGGFPINFDLSGLSVANKDIDVTRSLGLGGIMQAIMFFHDSRIMDKSAGCYILDPEIQAYIMEKYLETNPDRYLETVAHHLKEPEWIKNQSIELAKPKGIYHPCNLLCDARESSAAVIPS